MTTFFDNGLCYVIVNQSKYSWPAAEDACATNIKTSILAQSHYGRIATFQQNGNAYQDFMARLIATYPKLNGSTIWLGGKSKTQSAQSEWERTCISGYCWMTDANIVGSQICGNPNPIGFKLSSDPYCLYVPVGSPEYIAAENCDSGQHYMVCEYGKRSTVKCILLKNELICDLQDA